jgi:hypothetical protein
MDRGDLRDIDGFFAVLLWEDYQQTGNQKALDTLLAYNIQDTINLENLMVTAYNMELRDTPFYESHCIRESTPPPNPFRVDFKTVDRIKTVHSTGRHSNGIKIRDGWSPLKRSLEREIGSKRE